MTAASVGELIARGYDPLCVVQAWPNLLKLRMRDVVAAYRPKTGNEVRTI